MSQTAARILTPRIAVLCGARSQDLWSHWPVAAPRRWLPRVNRRWRRSVIVDSAERRARPLVPRLAVAAPIRRAIQIRIQIATSRPSQSKLIHANGVHDEKELRSLCLGYFLFGQSSEFGASRIPQRAAGFIPVVFTAVVFLAVRTACFIPVALF